MAPAPRARARRKLESSHSHTSFQVDRGFRRHLSNLGLDLSGHPARHRFVSSVSDGLGPLSLRRNTSLSVPPMAGSGSPHASSMALGGRRGGAHARSGERSRDLVGASRPEWTRRSSHRDRAVLDDAPRLARLRRFAAHGIRRDRHAGGLRGGGGPHGSGRQTDALSPGRVGARGRHPVLVHGNALLAKGGASALTTPHRLDGDARWRSRPRPGGKRRGGVVRFSISPRRR